jgi:hypothetical protein
MVERRGAYMFFVGKLEGGKLFGRPPGVDGRIILKKFLKSRVRRLRIWTGGWLL